MLIAFLIEFKNPENKFPSCEISRDNACFISRNALTVAIVNCIGLLLRNEVVGSEKISLGLEIKSSGLLQKIANVPSAWYHGTRSAAICSMLSVHIAAHLQVACLKNSCLISFGEITFNCCGLFGH